MKKIILLFILLTIVFSCKRVKDNDITKDNLKGDVIALINIVYKAQYKFGDLIQDDVLTDLSLSNYVKKYNKNGDTE